MADRSLLISVTIAIGLTIGSGWLHGELSQRWSDGEAMRKAAQKLDSFPLQIGPWRYQQDYQLDEVAIELLGCRGYVHRGYRHQQTGDYVKLAVMVGPGSKMSIHVPEICFEARDFTLLGPRQRHTVAHDSGRSDHLWCVSFQTNDVAQRKIRVAYGWSDGTAWQAPKMPRWSVASCPILYKLQLSYLLDANSDRSLDDDLVVETFMNDMLLALDELLD